MKRALGLFAVLLIFAAGLSAAKDIYGPKTISVDGKRVKMTESFKAKTSQEATLIVINGFNGPRAKSIKLVLNGSKIAKRKNVNSGVRSFSNNSITLQKKNSLKIIVKGADASVMIRIVDGKRNLLDRVVAIGDSLTAGMQDNTLVEERQVWSYPAQIRDAAQFGMTLPLISEPGIPSRSIELNDGIPTLLPPQDPGVRINPEEQAHNLAVPGADVDDVLNTKKISGEPQFETVLGGQRTMIDQVERLEPTLVIMWVGSNDVLGMVLDTAPASHSDLDEFKADYEEVLQRLTATGAKVAAVNLVDITAIPYLVSATDFGRPAEEKVGALDWVLHLLGQKPTVTEDEVLTQAELAEIRVTVDDFNDAIETLCDEYNVPVLDAKSLFAEIHENGISVAGTTLTTELLVGGVFSLDAVHPSSTAQAVVANEMIKLINKEFDANIPSINLEEVYLNDPLQQNAIELKRGIAVAEPSTLNAMKRILEKNPLHKIRK